MVLALAIVSAAYGKSYELNFANPVKAGKLELKPGKYLLTVDGDTAVFRDTHGRSDSTPVKVQSGSAKFKSTNVSYKGEEITRIELVGTTTVLVFSE